MVRFFLVLGWLVGSLAEAVKLVSDKVPTGERIQDGNQGTEVDSVNSVNQKSCWDAGATLGRNKAPRRIKFSTPWTPSSWKASPHHFTLRKQEGCCRCQMPAPSLLGRHSADQTGECQVSCGIPPATPGINQYIPLGRLTPPTKKKPWINNEMKTSTQQRGQEVWSAPEKGGRARSWSPCELSVNKWLEKQVGQ
jgi:hypothetical protein